MKVFAIALLTMGVVAAAPAFASTTTVDFTSYPQGTAFSNQIPGLSISLSGGPGPNGNPTNNSFGTNMLGNSPTGEYPTSEDLNFTFSSAASGISFNFNNFGDNYFAPSYFYAYGAGGSLVSSGDISSVNGGDVTVPGSGILELAVDNGTGGNSSWEFGVSSLTYSAATPEPSSLALLGTGLVGAAGMLRRRIVRS